MGNNIVDEFKKAENGILLGMESLKEGIDIPGESLQFVFIDKIPDLRMDLVINDRRDFLKKTSVTNLVIITYLVELGPSSKIRQALKNRL